MALSEIGLEHFWSSQPGQLILRSSQAPALNPLCWAALAVLVLTLATPSLIDKQPRARPLDYHPLMIWLLLNFLFATGAWLGRAWAAAVAITLGNFILIVLALTGARKPARYP